MLIYTVNGIPLEKSVNKYVLYTIHSYTPLRETSETSQNDIRPKSHQTAITICYIHENIIF